jgi:tungstate transport system ATP-binding protein
VELGTMSISLNLNQIEKNYHNVKALDSINFKAQGGKIIVLIGVNGAGKTSLLRIIAGLEKLEKGTIAFNGKNVSDGELRQIATLVFQRTAMFTRSVYANLSYGLKIKGEKESDIKEKIAQALHEVGLRDFEKRRAKKTSGGEQQRIALARAFLLEPRILLLDEPTANLDPNSAIIIERAILRIKKTERIIIMATHNLNQARRLGDEIVHMYAGQIVERASPDDFFDNPQSEITRKFINGELEF